MSQVSRASRVRRIIGAAAVALAVAGGAIAGPASAATLDQFSGNGTGYALRVTLDVRPLLNAVPALKPVLDQVWAAVPGQGGAFPGIIDQTFIKTTSDADASNTTATSKLADGLIDLDGITANKVGDNITKIVQTLAVPTKSMPILDGAVGTLKAAVATGPGVNGSGALENLKVGLPLSGLPTNVVDDLLAQLTGVVDNVTTQLTSQLDALLNNTSLGGNLVNQLTGTIDNLTGTLGAPALGNLASGLGLGNATELTDTAAVTDAVTNLLDVDALVNELKGLLNTSLLNGALAELSGLVNVTKAIRTGNGVAVADSVSTMKSLDVLGGLINVGLFNLNSHSEAAGVKGSAKNTSSCSIADVKVGDGALALSLDGKNIFVNGTPVPVVGDLISQVKGVVDQVLETLGISVDLCDTAQVDADPDGTAAAQRVSALRVKVAPLGLFSLVIDPTVETSVAAQVQAAPAVKTTNLPTTGAAPLATLLAGLGLAVGAFFLRRRFV